MTHAPRIWPESELHLVTTTGNARQRLFFGLADRDSFLDLLDVAVARFEWDLFAWSLLGNHAHIVVRARPDCLARGMQQLKCTYAIRFHRRHHTCGHLFKRPYDSRPITTVEQLHRRCGYTMANAVRHGFVDRAEDWEWSSFRALAGLAPPVRPNLGCEPFAKLLHLPAAGIGRLDVLRAYVRETPADAMISA